MCSKKEKSFRFHFILFFFFFCFIILDKQMWDCVPRVRGKFSVPFYFIVYSIFEAKVRDFLTGAHYSELFVLSTAGPCIQGSKRLIVD